MILTQFKKFISITKFKDFAIKLEISFNKVCVFQYYIIYLKYYI